MAFQQGTTSNYQSITNPVLPNPWTCKMPVGLLGLRDFLKNKPKPPHIRGQTPNKRTVTQSQVEMFKQKYKHLTKTQIRGAVQLSDNDLFLAKLFLDLRSCKVKETGYSLKKPTARNKENYSNGLVSNQIKLPPLGAYPKTVGVAPTPSLSGAASCRVTDRRLLGDVGNVSGFLQQNVTSSNEKLNTHKRNIESAKVGVHIKKEKGRYTSKLL